MKLWHLVISLFLLISLLSCGGTSPLQQVQYSQSIGDEDESGIGGTGILAQESGIGGTGIIGEITGFGSIFVNGVEVEIEEKTQLFMNGKKISQHNFALGDVLALRSIKVKDQNVANEIHLRHEVIGVVQKLIPQRQQFMVLGQTVDTRLLKKFPAVGQTVHVSGFRDRNDVIHASKISTSKKTNEVILLGTLKSAANAWFIGEQKLQLPKNSKAQQGLSFRLRGTLSNGVFQVKKMQRLNFLPFSSSVKNIIVQGFAQKTGTMQYTVSGYTFLVRSAALQKQLAKQSNSFVRLQLQNRDNNWQLNSVLDNQRLPMGTLRPSTRQIRTMQPDRPMQFQSPPSIPNRFYR